ncbi:dephospho-CoA kinase [Streptococcus cameli]
MSQIIGVTGGIASGKTTVTAYLREKGYVVIDADQVVHELQAKGGRLYQALVEWLGTSILQEDGELNRPVLSDLIFSSPENMATSAQLQNGIIRQELLERKEKTAKTEEVFFMDIPLLFELEFEDWFDAVWLVYISPETQLNRLMKRNQLSKEEARLRISKQASLEEKKNKADIVLDNTGTRECLYQQIDKLLKK